MTPHHTWHTRHHCNQRRPSRLPANTGIKIPATYQTARKGAASSTQYNA